MRDDPSLFKVVDNAGINVADQFDSEANAKQYVAHFVCGTPSSSNQSSQEEDICLIPEGCGIVVDFCDDGIDNDADGSVDEDCPPPALPEPLICPFPNTIEAIEAGCVVDWKGKPCPFPNTMEAIEGGGIDIPQDRPGGTIYCPIGTTQEQPCRGTNGRDNIEGTTSGDWIEALDGDDTIYAGSGIDSIRSGAGSDTIYSDAGTDYITAGPGNETYMVDMAMTC